MRLVNELFQIMNSKEPISWSDEDDGTGNPIGLRDKVNTSHGLTLNKFAKQYGVSVESLKNASGLPSGDSIPQPGTLLLIDRLQILESICGYFRTWKSQVTSLNGFTKKQKQEMFITHWLYDDLRRTCLGMVGVVRQYVTRTDRRWVPRRFSQDPIESLFGQIRGLCGSNTSMNTIDVDMGIDEIRSLILQKHGVN